MPIRQLPPLLINQIAAGEVIERPASVVKELAENAIDAGATRIAVTIEEGGKELISIVDDGSGIPEDELLLAISPHATSKIDSPDDLDAIATMGFRGEALASIASISRMTMTSRPHDASSAAEIRVEADTVDGPKPASGPVGTTVTVRNLFFNTPARRKFLRTDMTESTRIRDVVERLALAHPSVAWQYTQDGRQVIDLPGDQTPVRRVVSVLGTELSDELLEVDHSERGIRVWGMAGQPAIARGTARHQRTFLNGRPIVDRGINHAIKEAYRGLIEPTRYPTIVLFIAIAPDEVDVNVHPAKAEVRFRNQSAVHQAVLHAVQQRLRAADLTPTVDLSRSDPGLDASLLSSPEFGANVESASSGVTAAAAREFVQSLKSMTPTQRSVAYTEVKHALGDTAPASVETAPELPTMIATRPILQVHSSFVVTSDEQGIVIIDQHALHERVMFEKLRSRVSAGALQSQRLLMPATVSVDRSRMERLNELQPLLERLGIEAEPMGPTTIAVHAFTTLLFERKVDPASFMADLFERDDLPQDEEGALHEVLDMMSCKAAIKAGDRLTDEEMNELLRFREDVERSSNCPHGRPTSLRLTIADLERQFGRT
ncbi:MAG: DNA mismatch repair endonuclease MutL [Planctomycetota bacterium]